MFITKVWLKIKIHEQSTRASNVWGKIHDPSDFLTSSFLFVIQEYFPERFYIAFNLCEVGIFVGAISHLRKGHLHLRLLQKETCNALFH